jgi:hypothetical protein
VLIQAGGSEAVASGSHVAARQLLLLWEEEDEGVSRAGPRWASAGRQEEESWARFGPNKEGLFFSKVFPKSVFQIHLLFWEQFENSKFSEIIQSNHGPSLHIEAP